MTDDKSTSGTIVVEVVLNRETDPTAVAQVEQVLDRFVDALELGLFPPAMMHGRVEATVPAGVVQRRFRADQVPAHAFTTLAGMLHHFDQAVAAADGFSAWEPGAPRRALLSLREEPPGVPTPLPPGVVLDIEGWRSTPPLEITIDFTTPVGDSDRDRYICQLWTWQTLLQGGYSATGEIGQSATSEPEIRFLLPSRLRYVADAWFGAPSCFVPLLLLLERWGTRHRVERVEIEAR